MFCSKCGTENLDTSNFCYECGSSLIKPELEPEHEHVESPTPVPLQATASTIPATGFGMKWHKFLINFSLFAGAIINFSQGVMTMQGYNQGEDAEMVYFEYPDLKALDIANGLVLIVMAVLLIYTRVQLKKYKQNGPQALLLCNVLSGLVPAFFSFASVSAVVDLTVAPNAVAQVMGSCFAYFVLTIPILIINYVYYEKRSSLFIN